MDVAPAALFASPDHYLHSFDGDDALIVAMDRDAYARSIFLDARISPAGEGADRVPVRALLASLPTPASTMWIFHVAHCGSTLLARALEALGPNLVLREPVALRQVALAPDPQRLALTLAMLGKRYDLAMPTLVKANVPVNFILAEVAAFDAAAPAILLHCGLRDYLLAILRSDQHRAWVRGVTGLLAPHLGDLVGLSDAERAAALWLAQMQRFAAALTMMPAARSLDAETFFADPAAVLAAAARHFGIAADARAIDALVAGPLFATYSKNPGVAFDNAARVGRKAALEAALAHELEAARRWIERTAPDHAALAERIAEGALDLSRDAA